MNISKLMKSSKESLEGKWGLAIGTFLVIMLISGGIQYAGQDYIFMPLVSVLIAGPFGVGLSKFSLHLARNEEARFEDSFSGFSNFLSAFFAYILMAIIIVGGMILLIIPGIIAAIALSMTYFIIAEDSSISAIDALKLSHKIMDGHKMEYFYLVLRFIGLGILCVFTLGIGFLWLMPYVNVTNAKFYDSIKDETVVDIVIE